MHQRLIVALGCFLGACAAIERPPVTYDSLAAGTAAYDGAQRELLDASIDRLARRAVARGDRTLDLLLLSGGGQHGAYGIGFLRGWQARTDTPMPRFDMVTGVSTGSLQAPYALVGTPDALDTAGELYRNAADKFAPTPDWLFWLRRTGGLVDTTRFRAAIATAVDARMTEQLLQAAKDDRQLLIATTDFDLGVGKTWDLSAELARPGGAERAHDVLLASCSIPGIFPPQIIDGHVHADGGVIANALFPFGLADFQQLATRLRERGVTGSVRVRLWVVINIWTHVRIVPIEPSDRAQMSQRSTVVMFFAQQPQLLERLELLARTVTDRVPGLAMETRFTAIPEEFTNAPGAEKLFDETWMRRLEGIGYARAQSASPWDAIVSPYLRP